MTILENYTLGVIMAIEAEKAGRNDYPTHTLVVHDNLASRVEKAMGLPAHPHEISSALTHLERAGYIVMGRTINDIYAKIKHTNL